MLLAVAALVAAGAALLLHARVNQSRAAHASLSCKLFGRPALLSCMLSTTCVVLLYVSVADVHLCHSAHARALADQRHA
jgi:hypothetical protein